MKRLSPPIRRAVLTIHIVAGVGLLGTLAAELVLNIRAITTADAQLSASAYELLVMFPLLGIPFSFGSLISGVILGLGSKWGVLRYRWVTAKLVVIVSVILVGALLIGPQTSAMTDGDGSETALLVGSVYDIIALSLATWLSVYKPRSKGGFARRASASA